MGGNPSSSLSSESKDSEVDLSRFSADDQTFTGNGMNGTMEGKCGVAVSNLVKHSRHHYS